MENGDQKACLDCGEGTEYYTILEDWICGHCGYSERLERILNDKEYDMITTMAAIDDETH